MSKKNMSDDQSNASTKSGSGTAENPRSIGRKRIIDETLLNPEEARKLENQRAYNRLCAAKARKRTKETISNLQKQVDDLAGERDEMKRELAVSKAQLQVLQQQNQTLMLNQLTSQPRQISARPQLMGSTGLRGISDLGPATASIFPGAPRGANLSGTTFPGSSLAASLADRSNSPNGNSGEVAALLDRISADRMIAEYRHNLLQRQALEQSFKERSTPDEPSNKFNKG